MDEAVTTVATAAGAPAAGARSCGPTAPPRRPFLAPRLEALCHVAMCITMGDMLVLML